MSSSVINNSNKQTVDSPIANMVLQPVYFHPFCGRQQ